MGPPWTFPFRGAVGSCGGVAPGKAPRPATPFPATRWRIASVTSSSVYGLAALWRVPWRFVSKLCEEKIRYRTSAGAHFALWGIWIDRYFRGRRRRRERRAYACPHCDGWHLTSQPKRRR